MTTDSIKHDEHTKKFIDEFNRQVDLTKKYKLEEIKKILSDIFKNTKKNKRTKLDSNGNVIKKKPSLYNLFIKDNMEKIKKENPDIKDHKELLKKAAQLWKIEKEKNK